jgi:hypothetical protein
MSISPVSGGPVYQPQSQNTGFRSAFQQLTSAISSGDLQSAQQAYSTLSGLQQGQPNANSPFAQFLSQLGSDLSSGNIAGAQQDLQAFQKAHGHHHHHHAQSGDDNDGDGGGGAAGPAGSSGVLA